MLRSFALLGSSLSLFAAVRGDIILFPWTSNDGSFGNAVDAETGFGNSQPISAACASALNQTVACDPQMQLLAASGYVVSLDGAGSSLCAASCNSSLVAYRSAVTAACGASGAFDTYPNTWRGDIIYDYFNMVCDKDPGTGEYCPKWLKEQYAANGNPKLEDLPDSVLCSHCQINNMRTVQNSIFLGYNGAMVDTYRKIFTRCNVGAAATPKPPPEETFPNTADGANRTCLSGNTYMTQAGDSCHSIAVAKSVAEDTLASINDLGANCNRMTVENSTRFNLCLPKTCTTAQVGATDDCWSLSTQHNITFPQFKAYNPTINSDCTNLREGTVVCVSSPDGSYNPVSLPGSNSTWSQGEYAETAVPAPGNTAFGTTSRCGAYYQVQTADTCRRISIAAKVSVELFQEVNPSIDADCANLVPGLWYCVHPTYNWNDVPSNGTDTTPTSTVSPPAATPTGTTSECYQWHVVVSGDNCALLQSTLGVSMAQLMAWNPDLKADCSNLILGDAYCVKGPSSAVPSTTATATTTAGTTRTTSTATTSKPPASTTTSSTACTKTYTVQSGDWCSKIWAQFSLSESAFRALNPSLNANCDLSIGQVLCVAGTTPSTTTTKPPTSTTSPSSTPSSTATACAQTYTVQSGDWCSKIWSQFSLSEAAFRALNPSLNANCDLAVGQVLCVAAPSTCKKTYTVVSGDWCAKIWEQFGLSEAQFRGLNPGLDGDCDLDVGEKLCVG